MATGFFLSPAEQELILASVVSQPAKNFFSLTTQLPITVRLISGGGSDRRFFRVIKEGGSMILMVSPPGDRDFAFYLETGELLRSLKIGVPEFYQVIRNEEAIFMEDLGEESLYSRIKSGIRESELIFWYQKVLEVLVEIQLEGAKRCLVYPLLRERVFDYATLRWETNYFRENFLERFCGILIPDKFGLDKEFAALAEKVAAEPLYFIHRDFQSQNLMIKDEQIRIIDFQGARRGLLQYDLASILKDAYVVLSDETRNKLLEFYLEKLKEKGVVISDQEHFCEMFVLAGLQRNMQALGAFSFLSRVKGKKWFEQHIPAGVHYLHQALKERRDFPVLKAIINEVAFRFRREKDC